MHRRLRRRLRLLEGYVAMSSLALIVLAGSAFRQAPRAATNLGEITVERINVVDGNRTLRLIITNKDRFPLATSIDGRTVPRQAEPSAGLLFFNDEGIEDGGLTFMGRRRGSTVRADARLMFDQYQQDQTVGITYGEDDGLRTAGLAVWDRSDTTLSALAGQIETARALPTEAARTAALEKIAATAGGRRVFVGKQHDRAAVVSLSDGTGKARLNLSVAADGGAAIEFLDKTGKVVRRIAP
jgi:hypothetical protein